MKTTQRTLACIVIGSATLIAGFAPSAMAGPNIKTVVRSSTSGYGYSPTAGILVIDGVSFTIYSNRSIGRQIVHAFRECGYRASIVHGKVVVKYHDFSPNVRWYDRGFRASITKDHGRMSVNWYRAYKPKRRVGRSHQHWYDYGHHSGHGYPRHSPHHGSKWGWKGYPHGGGGGGGYDHKDRGRGHGSRGGHGRGGRGH